MYNINDNEAAIAEIQRYLVTINRSKGLVPCIVTDGIYDDATRECIRNFQRENFLRVTGVVDYVTFRTLYDEYRLALEILASPACVNILPDKLEAGTINKGEQSSSVAIIQALLKALEVIYDDFSVIDINGLFDDKTEAAVKRVQGLHSLTEDGIIDRKTFNAIVSEYEKFINKDM